MSSSDSPQTASCAASAPGPRSVLIAGCGYLGRRVADRWIRAGVRVTAITRQTARLAELQNAGIQPLLLDLARCQQLPQLPEVDAVLWAVGYDRSAGVSREAIWLDGLQRLIGGLSAHQPPQRFVYISSTSVYGDAGGQTVDETEPPAPTTEGGVACWQAEQLLRTCLQQQLPATQAVVLRMAGLYGPQRLLRRVSDLRAQVPLASAPDDWLNLIHVEDAAAMIQLAACWSPMPTLVNVVNSGTLTRRAYYTLLSRLLQAPPPVFTADTTDTAAAATSVDSATPQFSGSHRPRSGNKRVISLVRSQLPVTFCYDDVAAGLRQAVATDPLMAAAAD